MDNIISHSAADQWNLPVKFIQDGLSDVLEKWLDEDKGLPELEARREIKSQAIRKLQLLDDVFRDLTKQARCILEKAQEDLKLHRIPMNAAKRRGSIYYLYSKGNEDKSFFFSILTPEEYLKADAGARFVQAYRLNEDNTWMQM